MLTTFRQTAGLIAALTLLTVAFAAGPAPEADAKPKPKLGVWVVEAKQNFMLNRGVIRVRVKTHRKGKIRLRVRSATYDGNGVYKPFTEVAWPRFSRVGASRIIKVKLTASGLNQIASCQDREIQAKAGGTLSKPKVMVRQTPDCRPVPIDLSRAANCNFIAAPNPDICMSPFPDNYYSQADPRTETGRRINFTSEAMPANAGGTPIRPNPYRASDGFSQGQVISVRAPGLDNPTALANTNPVGLADPSRYLLPNAPVIVLNARTRERHPIWVEIDSNATSPATTNLLIHPMVNFEPGTRYIVAMRYLKDAAGSVLKAPAGFRYYRDFLPSTEGRINGRRSLYEDLFKRLRAVGIKRAGLYLAWDFTTASDQNNSRRALSMRNQAFAELGDEDLSDRVVQGDAPQFTVDSVDVDPSSEIARRIKGTFEVPCFLNHPTAADECQSGATMNLGPNGVPQMNGSYTAKLECIVPNSIVDPDSIDPADLPAAALRGRAIVYGHGLMGTIAGEIHAESQRKLAARGFTICGTDEIGMATEDIVTVTSALGDLSDFPKVADRLQQGLLNELFLARLMIHPEGLVSKAAFRFDPEAPDPALVPGGDPDVDVSNDPTLEPVLTTGAQVRAWYRGISQGGIMGGALMALSPDFDRGSLGVAAMNYSVMLTRSGSWSNYGGFFNPAYPNEIERPLALSLVQMLWDRGEPNGYAHRMTEDPLPGTPPHQVLLEIAFGDHLVTNWQSNVQARTIGAKAVGPLVASDRWPGVNGGWGIEPITSYPYSGSAIAYWDSGPLRPGEDPDELIGTDPPPITNTAPQEGRDPHGDPRVAGTAIDMVDGFLREGGAVTNHCAPGPCLSGGWIGP